MEHTKTLKLRIKDKHAKTLLAMAREVNLVWNYCNETSHRSIRERHQWLSGFDLQKLTNGLSKCDGVQIGVVSRKPRNFRQPSSSPATSASRSMNLPSVWKV